jgi:nicotinamidase/pyrazinamidase
MQNDFCPGGSLAVVGGDEIVPVINRSMEFFRNKGSLIAASRDWHPKKTGHFEKYGGKWPEHCVQGSFGAQFRKGLKLPAGTPVFSKGRVSEKDDYSALQATDDSGLSMAMFLENEGIRDIYVCGLATDYCVLETVLEGVRLGFSVSVLVDAVRGVNLIPGDAEKALDEMAAAGALLKTYSDLSEGT